ELLQASARRLRPARLPVENRLHGDANSHGRLFWPSIASGLFEFLRESFHDGGLSCRCMAGNVTYHAESAQAFFLKDLPQVTILPERGGEERHEGWPHARECFWP